MDAPLYDVYLTGKLADNISVEEATQRLATLFKSSPAVMAGMLTGKPQLLKRGLDKNAALKYREALLAAGVEVAFKAQAGAQPIPAAQADTSAPAPSIPAASTPATSALSLAPVGSDVLLESERSQPIAAVIDTNALQLSPPGPLPTIAPVPIAAPDISHLSLAAAGSDLLSAAEKYDLPIAVPDTSELSLAPVGAPLETLSSAMPPLNPDTSALSLAPPGSELLTPEQRSKSDAVAPRTDHLTLAN